MWEGHTPSYILPLLHYIFPRFFDRRVMFLMHPLKLNAGCENCGGFFHILGIYNTPSHILPSSSTYFSRFLDRRVMCLMHPLDWKWNCIFFIIKGWTVFCRFFDRRVMCLMHPLKLKASSENCIFFIFWEKTILQKFTKSMQRNAYFEF